MQVLLFAGDAKDSFKDLFNRIKTVVDDNKVFFFAKLDHLVLWLKKPREKKIGSIAVLHPKNNEELTSILMIQHMLEGLRLIIILPDRTDETVSNGLKLHPRFLSFQDNNYDEVYAVIKKMTSGGNEKAKEVA